MELRKISHKLFFSACWYTSFLRLLGGDLAKGGREKREDQAASSPATSSPLAGYLLGGSEGMYSTCTYFRPYRQTYASIAQTNTKRSSSKKLRITASGRRRLDLSSPSRRQGDVPTTLRCTAPTDSIQTERHLPAISLDPGRIFLPEKGNEWKQL